jgi:hypothetical protein
MRAISLIDPMMSAIEILRHLVACYPCRQNEQGALMVSHTLRATFVAAFLTVCAGQVQISHDTNPIAGLWMIHRILLAGHASGSLAYSGCGFDKRVPPRSSPVGSS